jgi:hypothetical protein
VHPAAVAQRGLGGPGRGPVDASARALGPTAGHLVGHGIGEALDGPAGVHDVAVQVDEAVQLDERALSVPPQEGQPHRAEVAPDDGHRIGHRRWEPCAVDRGWAPALGPGDDRVEQVAERGEPAHVCEALLGQLVERGLEPRHVGVDLLLLGVEHPAPGGAQAQVARAVPEPPHGAVPQGQRGFSPGPTGRRVDVHAGSSVEGRRGWGGSRTAEPGVGPERQMVPGGV